VKKKKIKKCDVALLPQGRKTLRTQHLWRPNRPTAENVELNSHYSATYSSAVITEITDTKLKCRTLQ